MALRTRPLLIAPLIPLLGILGIFGIDALHGSRWFLAFVVLWCLLAGWLTAYVVVQLMKARRRRR